MNEMHYHSLAARLLRYFQANPDEELSRKDIMDKFSVAEGTMNNAIEKLRRLGELESVHVVRLRSKGIAK